MYAQHGFTTELHRLTNLSIQIRFHHIWKTNFQPSFQRLPHTNPDDFLKYLDKAKLIQ